VKYKKAMTNKERSWKSKMSESTSDRMQGLVNKASDMITSAYENMEDGNYAASIAQFEKGLMVLDNLYKIKDLKDIQVSNYRTVTPFQMISDLQQCYLNLEKVKEAIDLMERYPSVYKNKRNMLLIKSHIYGLNRDWKMEMKCYKELIKLNKKDAKIYIKIANSMKETHPANTKDIKDMLDRSRKYVKKDMELSAELARAYRVLINDQDTATEILDLVRNIKKEKPYEYWFERGEIYLELNDLDLAFGAFEYALEKKTHDIPSLAKLIGS
jgi:tetratricopeptide (TPR) repeat protein